MNQIVPSSGIHFQNLYENQIIKETKISVALVENIFWPFS